MKNFPRFRYLKPYNAPQKCLFVFLLLFCFLPVLTGQSEPDTIISQFVEKVQKIEPREKAWPYFSNEYDVSEDRNFFIPRPDRYNVRKRIPVSNLPKAINVVEQAPGGKFFVAYEQTEVGADTFYILSDRGVTINRITFGVYPRIRFSANGKYATISNNFGPEFLIVDSAGLVIYRCQDYKSLGIPKTEPLIHVDVFPNGEAFLVSSSGLRCFSIRDRKLLWVYDKTIEESAVFPGNKPVLVQRSGGLYFLNKTTGKEIEAITGGCRGQLWAGGRIEMQCDHGVYEVRVK
ncbi:MAG TPA: hypothetical protein PK228_19380 [Saprospiraceae bacterium]|nr:hypothetical protein [Saprospiraceae bacterium]